MLSSQRAMILMVTYPALVAILIIAVQQSSLEQAVRYRSRCEMVAFVATWTHVV